MTAATVLHNDLRAALSYEAPFLIEKLVQDYIVRSESDAEDLFREVKRYIVFVQANRDSIWDMHSLRIDEAWHQFVLFTREYIDFCHEYFGMYVQHRPANAPETDAGDTDGEPEHVPLRLGTFEEFAQRYQIFYREPLPDVWRDENAVTRDQRLLNKLANKLAVHIGDGMAHLVNPSTGDRLFSVSELAREGLEMIARTGTFFVREIPGELSDDEKVAIAASLVQAKLLRTAP